MERLFVEMTSPHRSAQPPPHTRAWGTSRLRSIDLIRLSCMQKLAEEGGEGSPQRRLFGGLSPGKPLRLRVAPFARQ